MKKIAIIDDNKGVREGIKKIISYNFKDQFELKEANDVASGYNIITTFKPDLVLLDIEMSDGTGLDLINLFLTIDFKLVFITAYKDYALKAIKYRPHEYLIKPVNPYDIIKIINIISSDEHLKEQNSKSLKKIAIKNQDCTIIINTKEIIRLEAEGSYTKIITKEETHISSKNLKYYTSLLLNTGFLRIHNAHLVNADFIKTFDRYVQKGLLLANGEKIPVSSRRLKVITEYLERLS